MTEFGLHWSARLRPSVRTKGQGSPCTNLKQMHASADLIIFNSQSHHLVMEKTLPTLLPAEAAMRGDILERGVEGGGLTARSQFFFFFF